MELSRSRDELIEEFLPVVRRVASTFVCRYPHLKPIEDDLVSVGFLKVVKVVEGYLSGRIGRNINNSFHFGSYVRISIKTSFSDYVRTKDTIPAPKGRWIPIVPIMGDKVDPKTENNANPDRLHDVCRNGVERTVVVMALSGSTRKEIADYLCISQIEVREIVGAILSRV